MVGTGKMRDINSISQIQHLAIELIYIHSIICPDFGRITIHLSTPKSGADEVSG
jgi:hypothetical protein